MDHLKPIVLTKKIESIRSDKYMTAVRGKPELPPNLSYWEEVMRMDKGNSIEGVSFRERIRRLVLDFLSLRFQGDMNEVIFYRTQETYRDSGEKDYYLS